MRGLPKIIPGSLRLLIESGDGKVLRIVLTLISIFRVFKYPSEPKLSTITNPFTGMKDQLDWYEVRSIRKLFDKFVPSRVPTGRSTPIPLRTAGPNFKISILGAPMDAWAFVYASPPELLSSLKTIATYFKSNLAEMLELEAELVNGVEFHKPGGQYCPILGKLSLKKEAAGKVRVFAIVDV